MNDILDSPAANSGRPLNYAGFWIRVAASLLDGLLLTFGCGILNLILDITPKKPEDMADPRNIALFLTVFILEWLGVILYQVLMESSSLQATLGKRAMGIMVGNNDGSRISFGNALGRYLSKILSSIFMIGFIMVSFDDRKQGLHDKLAGTVVFYEKR